MINNFIEERFPVDIALGAVGGPEYKTDIVVTVSGREYRNLDWSLSRLKYNITYGIKNQQQMESLLAFFRVVRGKAIGFRFKDWSDYKVSKELIGVGDGHEVNFQLVKQYRVGRNQYLRTITKIVDGTVKIFVDKKLFPSSNYKIDYNKGIVSFLTPLKVRAIITATFEFDVPVRFDVDYLPVIIEDRRLYSCRNINLVEIKA